MAAPSWVWAKSIRCHITEISRNEVKLDCGLSDGVSVGDKGIIFYEIKIGNAKKMITPANFTVINANPRDSLVRIDRTTGEIKIPYMAEVKLSVRPADLPTPPAPAAAPKAGSSADKVAEAVDILKKANSLYDIGRLDQARAEYEKILAMMPDDTWAKTRIQEIDKAQSGQRNIQSQLDYYHISADSALRYGQYLVARDYGIKALALDPNDIMAQSMLLKVLKQMRSLIYFETLPDTHPPLEAILQSQLRELTPPRPSQAVTAEQAPPPAITPKPTPVRPAPAPAKSMVSSEPSSPIISSLVSAWDYPMVLIRAEDFMMGESKRTAKFRNEMPQHLVHVNEYWIDKYEVTQELYQKFVDARKQPAPANWENGHFPAGQGNFPVTQVSWKDAYAYCRFVNKRLPTEMEWEYAARGPSGLSFPWGNRYDPAFANTVDSARDTPLAVLDLVNDRSPFGVVGLAGNVSEWVDNWYLPYPQNNFPEADYGQRFKVVRGGSFRSQSQFARTGFRGYRDPSSPAEDIGFRCARTVSATNGR
jgi:formylglycine-generating enzyme required for sulfatase activity